MLSPGIYWKCACGCAGGRVTAPRRLWPPEELAALSEGGGSSFTSGGDIGYLIDTSINW